MKITEMFGNVAVEWVKHAFNNSPIGMVIFSNDNIILDVNDAFCRTFRYTREQMLGHKVEESMNEGEGLEFSVDRERYLKTGIPSRRVYHQIRRGDGEFIYIVAYSSLIHDHNGQPIATLSIAEDVTDRHLAEEKLRQSEEKYRTLHESMRDGFVMTDMDGRLLDCNDTFRLMLGYRPGENILSHHYLDFTPPHWYELEQKIIDEQVLVRGFSDVFEKELRRRDGIVFPVELRTTLLRDEKGQPSAMWSMVRDISERKRAENELIETKAFLEAALEQNPSAMIILDKEGPKVRLINRALSQIYGIPYEDANKLLIGNPPYFSEWAKNLDNQPYPDNSTPMLRSVLSGEQCRDEIMLMPLADGKDHTISVNSGPVRDALGQIIGCVANITDITDKMKSDEKLRRTKAQLQTALDQSPTGVILFERDGDIMRTIVNRAAAEMLGQEYHGGGEFTSKRPPQRLWKAFHQDGTPWPHDQLPMRQALNEGTISTDLEMEIERADKTRRWLLTSSAPIRDNTGAIIGAITNLVDITARKAAQNERDLLFQEINQKNEELESIISAISHDLRTPLINLQGYGELLMQYCNVIRSHVEQCGSSTKKVVMPIATQLIPQAVKVVQNNTQKMERMISGLQQVSRAGLQPLQFQSICMNTLIGDILEGKKFDIERRSAIVTHENLPECYGDRDQIVKVFTNLIDNAFKYVRTNEHPVVSISGQIEGQESIYCVQDNGQGIAAQHQEQIWQMFHRLNPHQDIPGEGLGLTIVRRIVMRHGGRVWVESMEGQGCKFFISLPSSAERCATFFPSRTHSEQ